MGREVSSPIIFDPPLFDTLPLLKPQEMPSFIPTFNLVKRLIPHSQCCSKPRIFENG